MELTLYRCTDDRRVFAKTLEDDFEVVGTLKIPSSTTRLGVTVRGDVETLIGYNYAYIPKFGRYYFVDQSTVIANGLVLLSLYVDVLMSYKKQIMACSGHITKSESPTQYSLEKKLLDTNTVKQIEFDNPFNFEGVNIMVCANGSAIN